jgi:hypothetical protein
VIRCDVVPWQGLMEPCHPPHVFFPMTIGVALASLIRSACHQHSGGGHP